MNRVLLIFGMYLSSNLAVAYYYEPPQKPNLIGKNYAQLVANSAYAAYLSETCSKGNSVRSGFYELAGYLALYQGSKEGIIQEFIQKKKSYASNSNVIDTGKLCYLNSAKTNATIADTEDFIARYISWAKDRKIAYENAIATWKERERSYQQSVYDAEQKRIAEANYEAERIRIAEIKAQQDKESVIYALKSKSMTVTDRDAEYILREAYPLAGIFGKLNYQSTDFLDMRDTGNGYVVKTRLNYLNLMDSRQYLKIDFYYDYQGNGSSWGFAGHSDVIAPKQLTASTLLQLLSK